MSDESSSRTFDLSLPQLIGSTVAATAAAALSTRFGLAGTILGAGLATLVSMVVATAVAGWLSRAGDLARWRRPSRIRGLLVGATALALVALAFHTGTQLLLHDLPHDSFAARMLGQMGLGPDGV